MPSLHWIGKDKVINHHLEVPYRLLKKGYSFGEENSGNKIIRGDNLEALKALLPEYEGKIKCICIDPPYNTGNEGWVYNDNTSDPKIKKWLGDVVGKEGEDLTRHDKWLCMMYPRLKFLHKLLSQDGIIILNIDEYEVNSLSLLMHEIFGRNNNLGTIVWDKRNPKGDSKGIAVQHESILVYAKEKNCVGEIKRQKKNADKMIKKARDLFLKIGKKMLPDDISEVVKKYKIDKTIFENLLTIADIEWVNEQFQKWLTKQKGLSGGEKAYKFIDGLGEVYRNVSMAWPNKEKAPEEYFIPLIHPITKKSCPVPERGWRNPPETMKDLLLKGLIIFGENEKKQPERKYLLRENLLENISSIYSYGGSDDKFQKEIGILFENPKPNEFVTELLEIFSKPGDIILDSFAGSGTTAHAVLNLNSKNSDCKKRKFILVEMGEYAESITAERVKRVIKGYGEKEGTRGGFDFYDLGPALLTSDGLLDDEATEEEILAYICYTETALPLPTIKVVDHRYWLTRTEDRDHYFYYERERMTILDRTFLSSISEKMPYYTIWADQCHLSENVMKKHGITFRKIPRDIRNI